MPFFVGCSGIRLAQGKSLKLTVGRALPAQVSALSYVAVSAQYKTALCWVVVYLEPNLCSCLFAYKMKWLTLSFLFFKVDGEPWMMPPCVVKVSHLNQVQLQLASIILHRTIIIIIIISRVYWWYLPSLCVSPTRPICCTTSRPREQRKKKNRWPSKREPTRRRRQQQRVVLMYLTKTQSEEGCQKKKAKKKHNFTGHFFLTYGVRHKI